MKPYLNWKASYIKYVRKKQELLTDKIICKFTLFLVYVCLPKAYLHLFVYTVLHQLIYDPHIFQGITFSCSCLFPLIIMNAFPKFCSFLFYRTFLFLLYCVKLTPTFSVYLLIPIHKHQTHVIPMNYIIDAFYASIETTYQRCLFFQQTNRIKNGSVSFLYIVLGP